MPVLQLVRIENVLFVAVLAWVGLGSGRNAEPVSRSVIVILTVTAILAADNITNDIVDQQIDQVGGCSPTPART